MSKPRNFIIERHSTIYGWEILPGQLRNWKEARDASRIYTETTGRITRTKKTSKNKSEQTIDKDSWLLLNNITQG